MSGRARSGKPRGGGHTFNRYTNFAKSTVLHFILENALVAATTRTSTRIRSNPNSLNVLPSSTGAILPEAGTIFADCVETHRWPVSHFKQPRFSARASVKAPRCCCQPRSRVRFGQARSTYVHKGRSPALEYAELSGQYPPRPAFIHRRSTVDAD